MCIGNKKDHTGFALKKQLIKLFHERGSMGGVK
jgi:hypothetical protein